MEVLNQTEMRKSQIRYQETTVNHTLKKIFINSKYLFTNLSLINNFFTINKAKGFLNLKKI